MLSDCVATTCTCKNGVGATGTDCPVYGAAKCAACNHGFTVNHARTECIGKFILNEQIVIAV